MEHNNRTETEKVEGGEDNTLAKSRRDYLVFFRFSQALFLGLFTLGLNMIAGDAIEFAKVPIRSLSITTTFFGLMGTLITGYMAKESQAW